MTIREFFTNRLFWTRPKRPQLTSTELYSLYSHLRAQFDADEARYQSVSQ
jgi:hypothetical protein